MRIINAWKVDKILIDLSYCSLAKIVLCKIVSGDTILESFFFLNLWVGLRVKVDPLACLPVEQYLRLSAFQLNFFMAVPHHCKQWHIVFVYVSMWLAHD